MNKFIEFEPSTDEKIATQLLRKFREVYVYPYSYLNFNMIKGKFYPCGLLDESVEDEDFSLHTSKFFNDTVFLIIDVVLPYD
jgi:hypothetical protein